MLNTIDIFSAEKELLKHGFTVRSMFFGLDLYLIFSMFFVHDCQVGFIQDSGLLGHFIGIPKMAAGLPWRKSLEVSKISGIPHPVPHAQEVANSQRVIVRLPPRPSLRYWYHL